MTDFKLLILIVIDRRLSNRINLLSYYRIKKETILC